MLKQLATLFLAITLIIPCTLSTAAAKDSRREMMESSTIEKVMRKGTLRVGMSTFVPWAMKDKTGELIGFEIDVAKRLAKDMGVKVQFIPTKWSGIIPALLTGKFDVIIGGMGIRPDRNLKVNFTIPYDYSGMSMVANRKTAPGKSSVEEFNNKESRIVARIGTTAAAAAKKFLPKASLRLFDDEAQATQELLNGRADLFVSSKPGPATLAYKHSKTLYMPQEATFTKEPIGFAIQKSDIDTLNYFNNWIRVVEAEGWLEERRQYWFGGRSWESKLK